MKDAKKTTTKASAPRKKAAEVFSAEEKAAMREYAAEKKGRAKAGAVDGEAEILAKIAEMPEADRKLAERIHAVVRAAAPQLECRTWYGMPAYARDGKVVCFFQHAGKFKARYGTFGFNDAARLDDGNVWPTSFAVKALTKADEERLAALVKQAVG
jgi:uncharacterized protein YdhG (YjbR/CyaY superfamily)